MFGHDDHDDNDKPHDEHHGEEQPADDIVKPSDAPSSDDNWQHPGPPPDDEDSEDKPSKPPHHNAPAGFSFGQDDTAHKDHGSDNELIDLKQEALGKLSPLIGHLDQSPDEKFRTLMMMIQASDNQHLVRQAYETALKISDEKERAQALLDIVNEINYFTQNSQSE
jgi:hypothetical protein